MASGTHGPPSPEREGQPQRPDHPTLGKHGQLSYEDAMAHIDRVLAEGEPGGGFADDDDWRCPHCGNTADTGGFFPTLPDGTQVEPTLDSGWDGHYGCGDLRSVDVGDGFVSTE